MKKLTAFILLSSSLLYAQYLQTDKELVKTTFLRTFDKSIINTYLISGSGQKVNAALLSIAQSDDTTFVSEILKLDFEKYGDNIAFALGEMGQSNSSQKFITDKLLSGTSKHRRALFDAIGRIGSKETVEEFVDKAAATKSFNDNGLPLAILNLISRKIRLTGGKDTDYLVSVISSPAKDEKEKIDAAVALSRVGGFPKAEKAFIDLLRDNKSSDMLKSKILYCLNASNPFPSEPGLIKKFITSKSWLLRLSAARTFCFSKYDNFGELKEYLELIDDPNPNIAITAANALKNIKSDLLQKELIPYIEDKIFAGKITQNTADELFATLFSFSPDSIFVYINKFEHHVSQSSIYNVLTGYEKNPDKSYDYLKTHIKDAPTKDMLALLPALVSLQKFFHSDIEYNRLLLEQLNSGHAFATAIIANELDSSFIALDRDTLKSIILDKSKKNLNDAGYVECLLIFAELSGKIDSTFYKTILDLYSTSGIFAVSSFANSKLGKENTALENSEKIFDRVWEYSFKYDKIKITTQKGEIIVKLFPEIAPITAGNICKLANEKFFDGVIFHRVVPGFVIQSGDPTSTGWGGPPYSIVSEFSSLPFDLGYVGMASAGKDTEGSQWFIMQSYFPHLDGRYTNFGKVIEGMDVVNNIDQNDKVISIRPLN